jgi:hypothetical protein
MVMSPVIRSTLLSALLFVSFSPAAQCGEPAGTGVYVVYFSPLELLGAQGATDSRDILKSDDDLQWQVYVPADYDPKRPIGVMVYISPSRRGGLPNRRKKTLDEKNLIWIGARNAGNRVTVGKRMLLAMLAPKILARDYNLDSERICVSGFSGGGKMASHVSTVRPDVFRGGIHIGGAQIWHTKEPPPRLHALQANRHVFLSGRNDSYERLTRRVHAFYRSDGVENCELIVVSRMGHELPDRAVFGRAIDYLDLR